MLNVDKKGIVKFLFLLYVFYYVGDYENLVENLKIE